MFLNGILKIVIGISGIVITMIWFTKSSGKQDENNTYTLNKTKDHSSNVSEASNISTNSKAILDDKYKPMTFNFPAEEMDSTVLLDFSENDSEIKETTLLENDINQG